MNTVTQLQNIVNAAFDKLTEDKNPYFFPLIQSNEGIQSAQDQVIRYALTNRVSIGSAIGHLESAYAE